MNVADFARAWEGHTVEKSGEGSVERRFPLRRRLAGSDHSAVFLTELAGAGSPQAVVKIFPTYALDPARQLARWREAAKLSHPSLLRIIESGRSQFDNTPFFFVVVEFAEEDLSQILPQRALNAEEVTGMLPSVLDALEYLHRQGFVHGGVRPSNIMATGDQIKLPVESIYAAGEVKDKSRNLTPFDAPELKVSAMAPAADIWSLGMTLVAALRQHPLSLNPIQTTPPAIPADIPEPLRSIIGDCLVPDPSNRCSITEIRAWLQPAPASASKAAVRTSAASATAGTASVTERKVPSMPARSVSAPTLPLSRDPIPAKSAFSKSGWRVGVPVAAVVLIAALVLGQRIVSHRSETPATSAVTTQPAMPGPVAPSESPAPAATNAGANAPSATSEDGVVHRVIPNVSSGARRTIHGVIQIGVKVNVDATGKVYEAKLATSSPSAYFSRLAVEAAQQWQFSPQLNNGQPSPSTWILRFQFSRRSTQALPSRILP
ncbi:MAG TPA: TonB family protein [Candidatus Sulfotelmatobacter sp.]